ncbi:MAG: GC-type dockerin domain-anchored protein, partial [Planctomycetota bacterium]
HRPVRRARRRRARPQRDRAVPLGVISQLDVALFLERFFADDPGADLAAPFGVISQTDVEAFVDAFFGAGQ